MGKIDNNGIYITDGYAAKLEYRLKHLKKAEKEAWILSSDRTVEDVFPELSEILYERLVPLPITEYLKEKSAKTND